MGVRTHTSEGNPKSLDEFIGIIKRFAPFNMHVAYMQRLVSEICHYSYESTVRAPVFGRHQFFGTSFSAPQNIPEKPMEVYYLDE